MAALHVYSHFFDHCAQFDERAAITALESAGMRLTALNPNDPRGPCVLFFNGLSQGLLDLLREVSRNHVERVLAVAMSADLLLEGGAWRLLCVGASDVLAWDHSPTPGREVAARFKRWGDVDGVISSSLVRNNLIGESPTWKLLLRQLVEVARYTDAPVLITGESGTGKELAARLIHTLDTRPNKGDLITLDCTTVVPELSGSEFFGHERGAYTGAVVARDGAFALADRGTLFLDEVGELSPRLQSELLRVVQEHTYKRVGSNTWQQTSFRLVCATNRDLVEEERHGRFRRDFYHRIAAWNFMLPPLRERSGDILQLVRHFMSQLRPKEEPPPLDEPVCEYLLRREYPGNVRELKQLVTRIMSRHTGPGPITVGDLRGEAVAGMEERPADWRDTFFESAIRRALALGVGLKEISSSAAETAIRIAIGDENGNLQRAARKLRVTDRALQMRRAVRAAGTGPRPSAREGGGAN